MNHPGSNLVQRLQDKEPLVHAGMGHDEILRITNQVSIKKQIEVDRSRSIALAAHPAELSLDFKEGTQKLAGRQIGLQPGGGVQVRSLAWRAADRLGLMEGGNLGDLDAGTFLQRLQGTAE